MAKKKTGETAKKLDNKQKASTTEVSSEATKRPGSAVSQQFLPNKQQNASNIWRKQEKEQKNSTYGYVPFKTAPLPIYGMRNNSTASATSRSNTNNNSNDESPRLSSRNQFFSQYTTAAPIQSQRADSAMSVGLRFDSRPGSELGLHKTPSRYQSYTTLPRPEHVEIDGFRHYYPQPQKLDVYGTVYGTKTIFGAATTPQEVCASAPTVNGIRPPSVLSANCYGASLAAPYDTYPLPIPSLPALYVDTPNRRTIQMQVTDEIQRLGIKPIINWNILSLSSYLQIVFGTGLIGIGLARIFLRFDNAKGHELFYGISVLLAGLIGLFAVRQRSYALAVLGFVHCIINTVFFFLPFFSGILPMLSSGSFAVGAIGDNGRQKGNSNESFEMNMTLSVLSLLEVPHQIWFMYLHEFITSLIASIYGCKAGGALILHVESHRLAQYMNGGGGYLPNTAITGNPNYFRNESALKKEPL